MVEDRVHEDTNEVRMEKGVGCLGLHTAIWDPKKDEGYLEEQNPFLVQYIDGKPPIILTIGLVPRNTS